MRWLWLAIGLFCTSAQAADISIDTPEQGGKPAIAVISGTIVDGDTDKFRNVTGFSSRAIVVMTSDGGKIVPSIEIGQTIGLKGYWTLIPDDKRCASSCALIWLGDVKRFAGPSSAIGFHAAYSIDTFQESGIGNAVVGAYLTNIGLPMSAVVYITQSPPGSMTWLSFQDAAAHGIAVEPIAWRVPPAAPSLPSAAVPLAPMTAPLGYSAFKSATHVSIEYLANVAFRWSGQSAVTVASTKECAVRCLASQSCRAFTYFKQRSLCRLMDALTDRLSDPGADSGMKVQ